MHLAAAINEVNQGYRKGLTSVFVYNCKSVVRVFAKLQQDGFIENISAIEGSDMALVSLKVTARSACSVIKYLAGKQRGSSFRYNQLLHMHRFLTVEYYFNTPLGILSLRECLSLRTGGTIILSIS